MPAESALHYRNLDDAIEGTTAPQEVRDKLTLVTADYMDFDYRHRRGQLVIAAVLAAEVEVIFGRLRDARFPIKSVIPIKAFGWDDHASIRANNTSAFNYRLVAGTDEVSRHALGEAIDINPMLNPYIYPADGVPPVPFPYPHRNPNAPGAFVEGDAAVQAFNDLGWEWGGDWKTGPDFQHFEKIE